MIATLGALLSTRPQPAPEPESEPAPAQTQTGSCGESRYNQLKLYT